MEKPEFSEEDYLWDYKNGYEWMRRVRKGLPSLIISVAITGGIQGKEMNPNLPETKDEQAKQAYDAYKGFCDRIGLGPLTGRAFGDLLNELDMYSLVRTRVLSRGRYGRSREITLDLPETLVERLHTTILLNFELGT